MIVQKFGGTSVGGAAPIRRLAEIVARALPRRPVVVVSAVGGVTNELFRLGAQALAKTDWKAAHAALAARHRTILTELALDPALLDPLLDELAGLLRGIELIGEATPRTQDQLASFGERLSVRIVAAHLAKTGLPARAFDAWDAGLVTDSRFGGARPLPEAPARIRAALEGFQGVPVITGYVAKDAHGHVTTLGRGGSDWSAAIFGAALGAEEIQIWTDVDGVMTADPRIVPHAKQREKLSFAEAAELAFFGAKVLHPATMVPAIEKDIPIRVLNSFRPEVPGTTVVARLLAHERGVKSIASKHGIAVVNVVAAPMLLQFGFLERVADVFARHEVVVDVIATSEVSLALTTEPNARLEPVVAELAAFSAVTVLRDMALVSVVGEELSDSQRVQATVLGTLAELGVKVEMLSYGATRNNLSVVLPEARLKETVSALHERLFGR
ncbi:MAG: aspartate kinase [Planctomycetes bacterium]|nr:aspartate kinase [Planctomycetota bacterium]